MTRSYHSGFDQGQPTSHDTVRKINERGQKKEKRRKCTYASRREKAHALRDEVHQLESQVAVLKVRSAGPGQESEVDAVLKNTQKENIKLGETIHSHHNHFSKMQSAISQYRVSARQTSCNIVAYCISLQQKSQQFHPLYTHIRLPKDWNLRRAKLMAIREEKLRNAYNFVMDPRHYVDASKVQYSDERFETAEGDFCGVRFEVVQFPGVESLQQVFNAAVYYLTIMEISITERLGHVTVRDDYETIDGSVYSARVLSTVCDNVTLEANSVLFPMMDPDEKYGMVVIDSIDEDELYPYNSAERVRKDVSATAVFTVGNDDKGELVVTMRRAAFLKIHRPQFAISEDALHELATGIMAWGDVMMKTLRGILYGSS
ncbi:Hypothetical protein PHPALM_20270 [Phytophthora palmivora]|uniref:Uncharacterized protein n=1 Tax=Phytophthora palmivora TaxID=4796 RepID=A0A2P4XF98_9STRA|nr:Hypothetical protein PHPALM_20270 [Phytophthora palmivora]